MLIVGNLDAPKFSAGEKIMGSIFPSFPKKTIRDGVAPPYKLLTLLTMLRLLSLPTLLTLLTQ